MASEPLPEVVEEYWIAVFDQFDTVVYPTIFAPRGVDRATALLLWSLNRLQISLETVEEMLDANAS